MLEAGCRLLALIRSVFTVLSLRLAVAQTNGCGSNKWSYMYVFTVLNKLEAGCGSNKWLYMYYVVG